VYLLQGDQFARLPVAALEHLRGSASNMKSHAHHVTAYRSIGSLAELLQLLEGAWVSSIVHGGDYGCGMAVAVAEVADANG
jgi:hypothetical protein